METHTDTRATTADAGRFTTDDCVEHLRQEVDRLERMSRAKDDTIARLQRQIFGAGRPDIRRDGMTGERPQIIKLASAISQLLTQNNDAKF